MPCSGMMKPSSSSLPSSSSTVALMDAAGGGEHWYPGWFRAAPVAAPAKPCLVPVAQDVRGEFGLAQASGLGFVPDGVRQAHVQHPVGLRHGALGLLRSR